MKSPREDSEVKGVLIECAGISSPVKHVSKANVKSDALGRKGIENLTIRARALDALPVISVLIAGLDLRLVIFGSQFAKEVNDKSEDIPGWCMAVTILSTTSLLGSIGVIIETSARSFFWTRIAIHDTKGADQCMTNTRWHKSRTLLLGYSLVGTFCASLCVAFPPLPLWIVIVNVGAIFCMSIFIGHIVCRLYEEGMSQSEGIMVKRYGVLCEKTTEEDVKSRESFKVDDSNNKFLGSKLEKLSNEESMELLMSQQTSFVEPTEKKTEEPNDIEGKLPGLKHDPQ